MYKANGLNFKSKKDYVKGTADIEWEMFRNDVADGNRESMPSKENFINAVYGSLMNGISNGVWSEMDNEGSSGSVEVPEEIRLMGARGIKAAIGEFWEAQDDKPVESAADVVAEDHRKDEKTTKVEVHVHGHFNIDFVRAFESEKEARKFIKNGKAFDSELTFELEVITVVKVREVF